MNHNEYILTICKNAKHASRSVAKLTTGEKNSLLEGIARKLREKTGYIENENRKDLEEAKKAGLSSAMQDRLLLNRDRIEGMASSIEEIAMLEDPVGRVERMKIRPSGIRVGQMRVPVGVLAVIFESRPNVTTDIAALSVKSGNACILRGGKEAIHSNTALYEVITGAIREAGLPESIVTLITSTDRELVPILLKMNGYIDLVIPRGGEGLIKMVTGESTIPVIKHDKGLCHIFIDADADGEMAVKIAVNAKTQRPGVCNAMESLLIHEGYPHKESLLGELIGRGVEIRGCERTVSLMPGRVIPATDDDFNTEHLDLILSVKIVDTMEEAMEHIARYGSGHSEAIVTSDYLNAERFLKEVDSSAVFVNASTRFHDGGEFGLGAEVGISTQKLHARGTMGVEGLTTLKYIVYGKGETR